MRIISFRCHSVNRNNKKRNASVRLPNAFKVKRSGCCFVRCGRVFRFDRKYEIQKQQKIDSITKKIEEAVLLAAAVILGALVLKKLLGR